MRHERIEMNPEIMFGKPVVKGTRITVEQVLRKLAGGAVFPIIPLLMDKISNIMPEPRVFTVVRRNDESGVSGPGRVLDGIIFHDGQVVVCWRGDVNNEDGCSSLGVYSCWDDFKGIHIDPHPANHAQVVFGECEIEDHLQECGLNRLVEERRAGEENESGGG